MNCWSKQALVIRWARVGSLIDLLEPMGQGEIAVEAGFEPFHIIDEQECLECMPGAGRWHGPEGCLIPVDMFHSLGTPEEK